MNLNKNIKGENYEWAFQDSKPFARGGNSEIFMVKTKDLDGDFALKIITEEKNLTLRRERFLSEIRIIQELEDIPGSIKIIDHGFLSQKPFYVMHYYENGTMADKYFKSTSAPKSTIDVLEDFKRIILIIRRIHNSGVAIRDIKPQNILLDSDGLPIISDFGLSLPIDMDSEQRHTLTAEQIGSQGYMAPEFDGKNPNLNHLSGDIWSLGRVLWGFCCKKKPPVNFETLGGGDTHLNRYLDRHIANLIQGVVTSCTSQDPLTRPNISELIDMTEDLIQNVKIEKSEDQKRFEKLESFLERSGQQVKNSSPVIDSSRIDSELNIKINELKETSELIHQAVQEFIPVLNETHSDIGNFRASRREKDWTNSVKNIQKHSNTRLAYSVTLRFDANDKQVEFNNMSYVLTKFQFGLTSDNEFYWSIYSRDQGRRKEFHTEEIKTKSILVLAQNKVNKIEEYVKSPFLELLLENFK